MRLGMLVVAWRAGYRIMIWNLLLVNGWDFSRIDHPTFVFGNFSLYRRAPWQDVSGTFEGVRDIHASMVAQPVLGRPEEGVDRLPDAGALQGAHLYHRNALIDHDRDELAALGNLVVHDNAALLELPVRSAWMRRLTCLIALYR